MLPINFEEIVRHHQRNLHRLAYRLVGNSADAQDIVQDTFLSAYENLHQLHQPGKVEAWLYCIARNRCHSWLRQRQRRLELLDSELVQACVPAFPPAPDEHLIQGELRERILAAIEQLPPAQHEAARLFYLESLSYQAIQERLGISKGLLGWRLHQARERLQRKLSEAFRGIVPAWLLRRRMTIPITIPITIPVTIPVPFVALSLLLHLLLWVAAPHLVVWRTEPAQAGQEMLLPVTLLQEGFLDRPGEGRLPLQGKRPAPPRPLPLPAPPSLNPLSVEPPGFQIASAPLPLLSSGTLDARAALAAPPGLGPRVAHPAPENVSLQRQGNLPRIGFSVPEQVDASQATASGEAASPASRTPEGIWQILFVESGRLYRMDPDDGKQQEIPASRSGYLHDLAVSPNGRLLAFTAYASGGRGIWTLDLDDPQDARLITPDQLAWSPTWSPDGTQIAFVSTAVGRSPSDVWIMQADGSHRVNLTRNANDDLDPAWSPDGSQIAFASRTPRGTAHDIFLIDLATGKRTRLTRDAARGIESLEPAWHPDGIAIAYSRGKRWIYAIYLMGRDGRNKRQVVENGGQPVWSPDGHQILFMRGHRQGELWQVNVGGKEPRRVTEESSQALSPGWILWSEETQKPQAQKPQAQTPTEMPAISLRSPEGSHIVFLRFLDGDTILAVRQSPKGVWRAEKRSLNDPNAVVPVTGFPLGVDRILRIEHVAARENQLAVAMVGENSLSGWTWIWNGERRQMHTYPALWYGFDVAPDGRFAGVKNGRIQVMTPGRRAAGGPPRFGENVVLVRFDPPGDHLLSAQSDGTLAIWDPERGQSLYRWEAHDSMIRELAFSGDGHLLVSCASDGNVKLWNPATGEILGQQTAPGVRHLALSSDGVWLATEGANQIQIWRDLQPVRQLFGRWPMAFSPDDRWLATATPHEEEIAVWALTEE